MFMWFESCRFMWCEKISRMNCENHLYVRKGVLVAIIGLFQGIYGMVSVQCKVISSQ